MKISINWLNDYVQTGLSAERIGQILSDVGLCLDGIEHFEDDAVLNLDVTSNRGDCLGHIGVARELAAATGCELKLPSVDVKKSDKKADSFVKVEIAEPKLCNRYTARIIESVKVGATPEWMKKRLEAVGVRSVNNVVDATNYAMMETGQPPHAFDYSKIKEGKIIVRKAKSGEKIISINGSKCDLTENMLVIADPSGPVAIAGVMGGLETEVSDSTTTILLEEAHFDPVTIRTASRGLSLPSEASFRFERTVDKEMIEWASMRTAQLIVEVAGGKVCNGMVDAYPTKLERKQVDLRISRMNKLLGIEIASDKAVDILTKLNFEPVLKGDVITCKVPSWRSDIYREVDLIEEVARLYGFNNIPTEDKIEIKVTAADVRQKGILTAGAALNSCGYYETINVTFTDNSIAELFVEDKTKLGLGVKDVSRKNANLLRQTLLGSLFTVLKTNHNSKNTDCRIYEIADTFVPSSDKLPVEKTKVAVVCDGDLRDIRGVVEAVVNGFDNHAKIEFVPAELVWSHGGANVVVNGEVIGVAGVVNDMVKSKFDFKEITPAGAELDFESLLKLRGDVVKIQPISRFPAIERDLSIIIEEEVSWSNVVSAVNKRPCDKLEGVKFVEIYRGKGVPEGKKSVTLSLCFRDEDGTLTHEVVDGFVTDIIKSLEEAVGAVLRTA